MPCTRHRLSPRIHHLRGSEFEDHFRQPSILSSPTYAWCPRLLNPTNFHVLWWIPFFIYIFQNVRAPCTLVRFFRKKSHLGVWCSHIFKKNVRDFVRDKNIRSVFFGACTKKHLLGVCATHIRNGLKVKPRGNLSFLRKNGHFQRLFPS